MIRLRILKSKLMFSPDRAHTASEVMQYDKATTCTADLFPIGTGKTAVSHNRQCQHPHLSLGVSR